MVMRLLSASTAVLRLVQRFARDRAGNIATIFALTSVPLMLGAGGAVDYSTANSARTNMQGVLDSTALALVKTAGSQSASGLTSSATSLFNAQYTRSGVSGVNVAANYDSASGVLTLKAAATVNMNMMRLIGLNTMPVGATSKAKLGGSMLWPVCVLITDPDSNHTLLVKNKASIDFTNCMVQVNTANWDAVEARDTSYIHSVNGVNCFTGDIHYGDVTPPKQPTCTMLPDPYASLSVPQNSCDFTNYAVSTNVTLSPGTYCGGIKISSGANVTMSPGTYYIQNGDFQVLGSSNLTGNGVTLLLSGASTNVNINTTGTITMSPYTSGQWAGFLFYWDQPNSAKKGQKNVFSGATMNLSGILYFVGQTLTLTGGANVTVSPGSIIADFLLPDNAHLTLNGTVNSPGAHLTKAMDSSIPVLVQ
jgi:Flp pilus assembly protein TadG